MTKASDIITNALKNIGAIALEETPTDAESAEGLQALNNMLDTWTSESLMVFTTQPHVFPFVAAQAAYTLGDGGNFNTPRPTKIESVTIRSSNNIDFPCEIISQQDYSSIPAKTIQSSLPYKMFDDGNYPLRSLTFYPIPSDASYSAVLWMWQPFSTDTVLTTDMAFPPGYVEALEYNLSVRIAPKYGRTVSADLRQLAMETKAQVKRINTVATMKQMSMPNGLTIKTSYTLQDFLSGI